MSSRNRKPGRNSPWAASPDMLTVSQYAETFDVNIKEAIEEMDFERYDATLKRVYAHPKNLLRLSNRRIAEAQESKRNKNNDARYRTADRRSVRLRRMRLSIVDPRIMDQE